MEKGNYKTFILMLILSFVMMYAVMYLNVDQLDHIYLNITRLYMTLLMVSLMALLMLGVMKMMYKNKKLNTNIVLSSIAVFTLALIGVRTQTPIGDVQYMKGMIPHHSIAIMTSKHADLKYPEVKKLAQVLLMPRKRKLQR